MTDPIIKHYVSGLTGLDIDVSSIVASFNGNEYPLNEYDSPLHWADIEYTVKEIEFDDNKEQIDITKDVLTNKNRPLLRMNKRKKVLSHFKQLWKDHEKISVSKIDAYYEKKRLFKLKKQKDKSINKFVFKVAFDRSKGFAR